MYAPSAKLKAAAELERRRRARAKRKEPTMPLLEWMVRYRSMLSAERPFDLKQHRFLEEIYSSTAKQMVLYKSGQVGVSEYLISYALYACDKRSANVFYVFPTSTHVSEFSSQRIGSAIEEDVSPYLANIVVDANSKKGKRGSDKVSQKRVNNSWLYLRGGKVAPDGKAPQLKSVPADVLIVDEVDEVDPRAIPIARKRLGHSDLSEERMASTPSYPGHGIHAEWLKSNQCLYFFPCPACSNRQDIAISDIVTEFDGIKRPVAWHGKKEGRAYAACRQCGAEMDRMLDGEWVATHTDIEYAGYHVTKLISPRIDLLEVVNALNTTDATAQKEAYNQDLGVAHMPAGGGLSHADLDACVRDYALGARGQCYMGVDVGKVINVVIRAAANEETGERKQLHTGEVTSFEDVGNLIERYEPRIVVIDALPETRNVRQLQSDFRRGQVWLAYYVGQKEGNKKSKIAEWNRKEGRVLIDRTRALDETVARFFDSVNTLPANAKSIPNYYDQMSSSVRVLESRQDGSQVARWVESGADHYFHAENYCTVASLGRPLSQMASKRGVKNEKHQPHI